MYEILRKATLCFWALAGYILMSAFTEPATTIALKGIWQFRINPAGEVSFEVVKGTMVNPSKYRFDTYTKDSPDELKPNANENKPKTNEK
jgi:hypothetical protein